MLANDKCFKLHYDETALNTGKRCFGYSLAGALFMRISSRRTGRLIYSFSTTNTHPQSIGKDVFCIRIGYFRTVVGTTSLVDECSLLVLLKRTTNRGRTVPGLHVNA